MVLRSGIILPFQFRDTKKLLMIGVAEENRNLSIWDLKNVVRAAFGVYNFEFRNKKIGFNIPDELLLHYLAQRHDLTNFVIEIGQANDELNTIKDTTLCFEPSCSQKLNVPLPQKSNESVHDTAAPTYVTAESIMQLHQQHIKTPPLESLHGMEGSSNHEPAHKLRISQMYAEHTPESITQSIDPMDIIPKSEQDETDLDASRYETQTHLLQHQQQQSQQMQQHHHHQQQHQLEQQQHHQQQSHHLALTTQNALPGNASVLPTAAVAPPAHYFSSYGVVNQQHQQQPQTQIMPPAAPAPTTPNSYSPAMMNRFRRRGERMSKDQKELYVKYFEENRCMLTQRRNDIMLEPHWHKLASLLNSVPQGAVKNVEEWKQTFDAWRYRVFMYTRYNSKLPAVAAQNPKNFKPLTPTDQRAYDMWTSHKNTTPQDFEKMDIIAHLEETQTDYDY